ncbi:6-pyruvoyl trahydropterin synthase family protein [Streptomyces sp. H34-S4]|uniref:6-pyruvoyl trahydropterin synthase family protein n=1 Tax=Streptomyces sp. H34-S4 TaxID=2996463 RepID=UPI002271EEAD|nr:6-carboxytetrahydropterin synthase [Streptomyces sp. H34-S4]MCY0935978.1 6-carboxytetrahydropterin synthase [Streptomyces sp. H34-S4]
MGPTDQSGTGATGTQWRIGKAFRFEATRKVDGRHDGRSFTAEAVLSADALSKEGFVVDFGELDPLRLYIAATLDHRLLNEQVPDVSNRGLGQHLADWARLHLPAPAATALVEVRVRTGRPIPPAFAASAAFDATHRLEGLAADHQCTRLHGHSYLVTIPAEGAAYPRSANMPRILAHYVTGSFHGQVLNDVLPVNPTCELLAEHFARWLEGRTITPGNGRTMRVRVSETESSWAEFEGDLR